MKHPNLQVYPATHSGGETAQWGCEKPPAMSDRTQRELDLVTGLSPKRRVSLPLAKFTSILIDAAHQDRAWMDDFGDELIEMNADLHEILMAYQNMRTSKAA